MSQLIGREIVLELERVVELKLGLELEPENPQLRDQLEMSRRRLTDAFLAMDSRKGVYVATPEEEERMTQ